jgi:hypothetical protein
MAERARRRKSASPDAPGRELQEARSTALGFATLLGPRLAHADDGLAIASILTSAQRVAALVEARGIGDEVSIQRRATVDLGAALRRVLDLNRMAFTARGVALTTDPAPGVLAEIDEVGLDVTLSVLCCWAVLRAAPGTEVHAAVRAHGDAPTVRFRLTDAAPEDGCIRIARTLATAIGGRLEVDEDRGIVELVAPPG